MNLWRLLVLVIALIVPLQGMAAIAAGQCMALGHHKAPGHESQAQMRTHHAAHSHPDEVDESAADASLGNAQCSPCAACCASASIAATPALPTISGPAHPAYLWPQLPPAGFLPPGLERPPLDL